MRQKYQIQQFIVNGHQIGILVSPGNILVYRLVYPLRIVKFGISLKL